MSEGIWTDWLAPSAVDPEPRLVPTYGCRSFTPKTRCGDVHKGPIPHGSKLYCECCGKSGCDHWKALKIRPNEMPKRSNRKAPKPGRGGKDR